MNPNVKSYISDCTYAYYTDTAEGMASPELACLNCNATAHDDCGLFTDMLDVSENDKVLCSDRKILTQCHSKKPSDLPKDDPYYKKRNGKKKVDGTDTGSGTGTGGTGTSNANKFSNALKTHYLIASGIAALTLILLAVMIYFVYSKKKAPVASFRRFRRK
jgi:hypothetical protein